MSRENVEIVKASFLAWKERGVDGLLEFTQEDVEYLPADEGETLHGHDAVRRYFDRWLEPWADFRVDPREFLEAGDYVVAGIALSGRGKGSGIEIDMNYWSVMLIRDGKAARWEEYLDRAEAVEAAGLRE